MGAHYTPEVHKAVFETESQLTYICTIKNFSEMEEKIKYLENKNQYLEAENEYLKKLRAAVQKKKNQQSKKK